MSRDAGKTMNAPGKILQVDERAHESNLIETDAQKPKHKFLESSLREIAATVTVTLTRHVGVIHHRLEFCSAFETPRQSPRNGPKAMSPDASLRRHGMAHKAADAAISVWKGVDVIETMVR